MVQLHILFGLFSIVVASLCVLSLEYTILQIVHHLLQVQTNAFTVIFDERFSIPMDSSSLEEYSLRFAAFGIDADERNISAGVAELKLSDLDLTIRPFNAWLYLQDVNKVCWYRERQKNNAGTGTSKFCPCNVSGSTAVSDTICWTFNKTTCQIQTESRSGQWGCFLNGRSVQIFFYSIVKTMWQYQHKTNRYNLPW